jgi:formate-dependent nitrite reductase membrane component NrfD
MTQVVYNAQHKIPWHWPVPAYLVTKGIAAGLFLILSLGLGFGLFAFDSVSFLLSGLIILAFLGITTGFLVYDLEKPARFLRILLRPQWKSWLTRGAVLLVAFSTLAGIWFVGELAAWMDWISPDVAAAVRPWFMWIGLPLSVGAAVYTAFLFGQAEGRDLWQSTLLPVHLIVQALVAGAAALLLLNLFVSVPADIMTVAIRVFAGTLVLDLLVTLMGEFGMPHASEVAARAAHRISHGTYKKHFWWGSIVLGHVVALALLIPGTAVLNGVAAAASLIGLYLYEYAFVTAPQEIPNS